MKCTGERPRCKNCEIYEQECVFSGPTRRPRPTNAALNELLEENRRLREQVSTDSPPNRAQTEASHNDIGSSIAEQAIPLEGPPVNTVTAEPVRRQSDDPVETPASVGSTTYHGPTSTLFNEAASSNRQSRSYLTKERETWMPRILVAAAAEQRQLESINLRAGKLDFDGVDPELAFMRDMACNGPYFSKILLNAIFYGASKFSPRLDLRKDPSDVRTAGWQFRNRVRDLLGQALDHSEITTIQALLQMSNSLFALGDEQSAAWVYAGTAFRMLVDVGLHVDAAMMPNMQRFSEEDLEIRRRVYWSAYVVDKMQSLYQGRPASLRAIDGQVPIKFMDTYEELEQWHPFAYASGPSYPGSPSYSVSTFEQLCKLCMILQQILDRTYCEREQKRNTQDLVQDLEYVEKQLQDWMAGLPEHLRIDTSSDSGIQQLPPPHVFSLQCMWNVLRVLLHRPLVADGHLHSTLPSTSKSSLATCTEAAINIVKLVRLYDRSFSVRRAPYLISYATYVAATIHVRIAATRASTSEAHEHLRTCLAVFDQNSATNYAVKKASIVIENLKKRMGIKLDDPGPGTTSSATTRDTATDHPSSEVTPRSQSNAFASPSNTSSMARSHLPIDTMINHEPTMVAGQFDPDLDVDTIIHSFMHEQQLYNQPTNFPMPDHTTNNLYGGTMPPTTQGQMPSTSLESYDDALFGFNASAFDWFYPNPFSYPQN
ncbi:hypothetical protein E4T48_01803 [Aureobasidium sp. EXF-10727]|nr:hypothetical protein E4T48_01803 [Aureobasidium sp. EXF-10727]KAI4728923.1 hypothetical protein E4T49_03297 [Aureobasidium sp. EXF-10728]